MPEISPAIGGARLARLDALRALALSGALVSHAGLNRGGWIGVDLFFVLSGFLITSLLLTGANEPNAFRTFVTRRFRRLLPAALFMLLIVNGLMMAGLAPAIIAPERAYPQALSALLYVANWHEIWSGTAYWDQFAQSPFGHLWSLSIEEQFYVLFPLVMIGLRSIGLRGKQLAIGGLTAAAVTWSLYLGWSGARADRIYFGTDTRAVSLLVGAFAALLLADRARADRTRARRRTWEVIGLASLAILAAGSIWSDGKSGWVYRGGLVGTSFVELGIVLAAWVEPPILGRLLRWRPLVWVGERSYSIYLWHLPIYVFLARVIHEPVLLLVAGSSLAFLIAGLTHGPVEHWFRWRPPRRSTVVSIGALLVTAVVGVGLATWVSSRPEAVAEVAAAEPVVIDGSKLAGAVAHGDVAEIAPTTTPPVRKLMVVGDSVAVTLAARVSVPGVSIANEAVIGCAELRGQQLWLDGTWQTTSPDCRKFRDEQWPKRLGDADATLWLYGAWDMADTKVDGKVLTVGSPEFAAFLRSELDDATRVLTAGNRRLFITSALCYDKARYPDPNGRATAINGVLSGYAASHPQVTYLPLIDLLCDNGKEVSVDGEAARPDGVHFSTPASVKVWNWLLPYLRGTKT